MTKQYNARLFPEPKTTAVAKSADRQRARILPRTKPIRDALAESLTHADSASVKIVAIVGCGKTKGKEQALVRYLYRSPLFAKSLELAELLTPHVFVVSAEHGLVRPDAVALPYDHDLRTESPSARSLWARNVVRDLVDVTRGSVVRPVLLMGSTYADPLLSRLVGASKDLTTFLEPRDLMRGLGIGDRLAFLNQAIRLARSVKER